MISANEINDNNLNSIESSNLIGVDSVDDTSISSSDLTEDQNQENSQSLNENSEESSENSQSLNKNSEELSENPKAAETNTDGVSANIENNLNSNGLSENGEDETLESSKERTSITISNSTVLCGEYVYLYLKDHNGNRLSNKTINVTFNGKNYALTTNQNGITYLKLSTIGKFTLKAHFIGDSHYHENTTSFTINVYKLKTNLTVQSVSVLRGRYLYVDLKDSSGNAISGKQIIIKLNGKTYYRTTNSKGRIALSVYLTEGKYSTIVNFAGDISCYASSKTFTLHVLRTATAITVLNTSVIRGKYLFAYLKTSNGVPLVSKSIRIYFNNNIYYRTTNKDGRVGLTINKPAGSYVTKVIFNGDSYYRACSKSFYLKSYVASTKIIIQNLTVVRGNYLIAYLKDSYNNPLANQKLEITFGSSKYSRTTLANGKVGLKITAVPQNVSTKVHYAGSISYKACTRSFTTRVLTNATAKIIAKSQTCLGEYSFRLTDIKGNPLSGQTIKVITTAFNHTAGSGKKITQKKIIIDSDNILNPTKDKKFMNDLAAALRAKGYEVIVSNIGPNTHCEDAIRYSDSIILCLLGGVDSGCFVDMSSKYYQNYLKENNNRVVLAFEVPPVYTNLATCTWLNRAHDDDYSPDDFTGLAYPGTYLNQHGMDYIYGRSVTEMANNFIKYAVNGLSIGLNNTVPKDTKTYTVKTNSKGYATLSDLPSGTYTVQISYSNSALGYVADTVRTKIKVL